LHFSSLSLLQTKGKHRKRPKKDESKFFYDQSVSSRLKKKNETLLLLITTLSFHDFILETRNKVKMKIKGKKPDFSFSDLFL